MGDVAEVTDTADIGGTAKLRMLIVTIRKGPIHKTKKQNNYKLDPRVVLEPKYQRLFVGPPRVRRL